MDQFSNENEPPGVEVGVVEVHDAPGEWLVEAIDHGSEGEIYRAIFAGPQAKERALEYARDRYGHDGEVLTVRYPGPKPTPKLTVIEGDAALSLER